MPAPGIIPAGCGRGRAEHTGPYLRRHESARAADETCTEGRTRGGMRHGAAAEHIRCRCRRRLTRSAATVARCSRNSVPPRPDDTALHAAAGERTCTVPLGTGSCTHGICRDGRAAMAAAAA